MGKQKGRKDGSGEPVISIIGPGMKVLGNLEVEGSVRVEGHVQGDISAGKAVVVGEQGAVEGDIMTQDAVLSGTIKGTVVAASRLEVQASCRIDGEVRARRLQLEEGAVLNGTVAMGDEIGSASPPAAEGAAERATSEDGAAVGD